MRPGVPSILLLALSLGSGGAVSAQSVSFAFDFESGLHGWEGGYSDYSDESGFQFEWGRARLPEPLDTNRYGIRMKGMNVSDDMFMFLRRKVEGLEPGARYGAVFGIRLASDAATDAVGIGGSPATSVYLKAGAVAEKPLDVNGRMNIDKGNQSRPGRDMDTLGHVGAGEGATGYVSIARGNAGRPLSFTAAQDGTAWIILGTDSGFEGLTVLYYQRVEAVFTRQGGSAVKGGNRGARAEPGSGPGALVSADGRRLERTRAGGPGKAGFRAR